ncbi:MAG: biotin/lipoyl-containing protein, partial [Nocardioidaceae bacterium]
MPTSVTMPRLGESVTEGTVTRWLKSEGDHVDADEALLEVSTDKVDTEIPSPAAGTLLSIKVQEDETVEIGVELAVIGDGGDDAGSSGDGAEATADADTEAEPQAEAPAEAPAEPEPEPEPKAEAQPEPEPEPESEPEPAPKPAAQPTALPTAQPTAAAPAPAAAPQPASRPTAASKPPAADDDEVAGTYVTPLVRKLASEHNVDLAAIEGTGVGGRIRKSDVLAAVEKAAEAEAAAPAPAAAAPAAAAPAAASSPSHAANAQRGKVEKMSRMRQVIATRMVESLQTSAQLTTVVEVDVTRIA